jgi:methyl-accepting chemotaxis protein
MAEELKKFQSLRVKISMFIVLGIVIFSIIMITFIYFHLSGTLTNALIEQGRIVGENISELAAEKLIVDDLVSLRMDIEKHRQYSSIEYILIEDFNHQIQTDTYNGDVPPELIGANSYDASGEKKFNIKQVSVNLNNTNIKIYDILVPIKEGLMGFTRVGMKKSYVDSQIQNTLLYLGGITALGILISIIVALVIITTQITRPVLYLTNAAENISLGNLDLNIEVKVKNELQILASAIDRMRESLRTCLERMKARPVSRF